MQVNLPEDCENGRGNTECPPENFFRRAGKERLARRREIVRAYNRAFRGYEELELPTERPHVQSAWHLYVVRLNLDLLEIDRARFIDELKAHGISTSVHFIPVHMHAYYRAKYGYRSADFPSAYGSYRRIVSLPLHPGLSDEDVRRITGAVAQVIQKFRKKGPRR